MISLVGKNLTAGYGGVDIIKNINLEVKQGEIVVIVGPNGAGKSTAMKALLGMLKLTDGGVSFAEDDITFMLPQDRVNLGIAFVPQTQNVFTGMSVEENLEMGGFIRSDDIRLTIEDIYNLFPILKEKRNQNAGELSGGQRQQVAFGRALMTKPKILMLDEPTAGVSPIVMDELFSRIIEVGKTGVGILMVEQNAKQALNIADRGYVLVNGMNSREGSGQDLLNNPEVRKSFLGGKMIDILNSLVVLLNFIIIPGITYGSQLALGALGVTFVYAVLRFANFAHGELMSFGAMITILFTWFFQSSNIGLGILPTALLALPFGIIATIILSLISDKFVFKYYRQQKSVPVVLAMVSIGVMFVVNAIIRIIIGTDTIKFSDGQKFIMKAKQFKAITGLNEGLALKSSSVITILITIILLSFTFWFLQKTKTGKSMRAFSDNEDLALLSGINPNKVVFVTWLIVGTLACVAGTLYGLDKSYKPIIYLNLVLPVFASAIVGGIGSPFGAVVGGYVIAFSEIMVTYAYKKFFKYLLPDSLEPTSLVQILSTDYKFAVSFTILVIVLLIRPSGIFKGRVL